MYGVLGCLAQFEDRGVWIMDGGHLGKSNSQRPTLDDDDDDSKWCQFLLQLKAKFDKPYKVVEKY